MRDENVGTDFMDTQLTEYIPEVEMTEEIPEIEMTLWTLKEIEAMRRAALMAGAICPARSGHGPGCSKTSVSGSCTLSRASTSMLGPTSRIALTRRLADW
ncbi:hypothetical protein EC991_006741 [Linnemannia zychae]|nr:hypothetical protein EC991_006741 [Linnemannia zychae]